MKLLKNEHGLANLLVIPLIISGVLLVSTIGFAAWAFTSRQDFKDNADQKIEAAVAVNTKEVSDRKDNEFLEQEKFPLDNFQGDSQLGSVKISYPKTWSAYIEEEENEASYIFNPKFVNADNDSSNALRVEVEERRYSDTVASYDSQLLRGEMKAKAYSLPRVSSVVGVRLNGTFSDGKQGSVVVLPLRDKSIQIFTEVPSLEKDYTNIILANFTFNP